MLVSALSLNVARRKVERVKGQEILNKFQWSTDQRTLPNRKGETTKQHQPHYRKWAQAIRSKDENMSLAENVVMESMYASNVRETMRKVLGAKGKDRRCF